VSHDQLGVVSEASPGGLVLRPERVAGLTAIVELAGGGILGPNGYGHSLALDADGQVWAWGYNIRGQLGDGTTGRKGEPVPVDVPDAAGVAAAGFTSLARLENGSLWSWGSNARGQLGDGGSEPRHVPGQVAGLAEVIAVAAGGAGDSVHVLALQRDGMVWAWGDNAHGQTGAGYDAWQPTPIRVAGLAPATTIAAGGNMSLALDDAGRVWVWGASEQGAGPRVVVGLEGVTLLAAGGEHALALDDTGRLWAWGGNDHGQLGDGSREDRPTPVLVRFGP
jgi:alpha-tubulin suppressor-like RCC1 family protein